MPSPVSGLNNYSMLVTPDFLYMAVGETFTLDTIPFRGGMGQACAFSPIQFVYNGADSETTTTVVVPAQPADPPFPPVWPYLFSTDIIYGRDNLSTNLKLIRGDKYEFDIAVTLNGAVVDLTGKVLTMTAKWAVTDLDAAAVFKISTTSGDIVVTDAVNGLATVTIVPAKTTGLPAHIVNLPFDLTLTDPLVATYVKTIMVGTLRVVPDLTIAP